MDYEEKYKNALEKARYYHSKGYMLINSAIEEIFPELKQSEGEKNEKIRKGLIKAFRTVGKFEWGGLNVPDILTWLEIQGEQNTLNPDKVIEWLKTEWEDLGINWVRGVYADEIIDQFKKDFGL